jgi:hypothetical protein
MVVILKDFSCYGAGWILHNIVFFFKLLYWTDLRGASGEILAV